MSTPHIEAQNGDYAETVLLPGVNILPKIS